MSAANVRTAFWYGDKVAIVEDIPAFVCSSCSEHFYGDEVSDALHDLAADAFSIDAATRLITVPVFSLAERLPSRTGNDRD